VAFFFFIKSIIHFIDNPIRTSIPIITITIDHAPMPKHIIYVITAIIAIIKRNISMSVIIVYSHLSQNTFSS